MSVKDVVVRLDQLLKPLGFSRRKETWSRKTGSFVDVIDVQINKIGEMLTVNAGVFHPDIYMKCWGEELDDNVQEVKCIVRARIGELLDGKDLWWSLSDQDAVEDIVQLTRKHVMPFLESMHSFDAMENFLTASQVMKKRYPPPIIYLAILRNELGNKAHACALLAELGEHTSGPWRVRIMETAQRLGCS